MYKIIIFLSLSTLLVADNLLLYYNDVIKTMHINKQLTLEERANTLRIQAQETSRFTNFGADINAGKTNAKLLPDTFTVIDMSLSDTLDIFNKNQYTIQTLHLDFLESKTLLSLQKEQLFISLVDMIAAYRKTKALFALHQTLYRRQTALKEKLQKAYKAGGLPKTELNRFITTLALFQSRIIQERENIHSMRAQLKLYAPHLQIPYLSSDTLTTNQKEFVEADPAVALNTIQSKKAQVRSDAIDHEWLPDAYVAVTQQFDDDPTANGDNYTFSAGLHMGFDGGNQKRSEASKVMALKISDQKVSLLIKRKQHYLSLKNRYIRAKKQRNALLSVNSKADQNLKAIEKAYTKNYIDFTTYLQTLHEMLSLQENLIESKYEMLQSATTLNTLSQGAIYE